jgi:hypothetical protein
MHHIAVTGPRRLNLDEHQAVIRDVRGLILCEGPRPVLHVGDALGVDAIARGFGRYTTMHLYSTEVGNRNLPQAAKLANRSARMVRELAAWRGTLHAWPNKPAPAGLRPARNWPRGANGSGTWGTIALAVGLGVPVELHWLCAEIPPEWMTTQQMALL